MWSFPRCVSGQEPSLGIWVWSKEGEKRQKGGGVVWEPGEGNLGKEGVELLQFSGSTLALSKYKRLPVGKPGEGECGGYERNPKPEVHTSIILGLRV